MTKRNHKQKRQMPVNDKPGANRTAAGAAGRRRRTEKSARKVSSRRRRRRRRGNMILYYLLLFLVIVSVGVTLSLTVFFGIETVTVTGTDKYTQQNLVQATGIALGDNLFRIDKQQIIENLLSFPYIEEVQVSRGYPPGLLVQVTEARPMAAVKTGGDYLVLSGKGRILEVGLQEPPDTALVVTGFAITGQPGEMAAEEHQENLLMIRYLLQAVTQTGFTGIQELDLSDRLNMVVNYENRIRLELGSEGELDYKLNFARTIIEQELEPGFKGIVDVSNLGQAWTREINVF